MKHIETGVAIILFVLLIIPFMLLVWLAGPRDHEDRE